MFGRKPKTPPEQLRDRRSRTESPAVNPAFSYYNSRTSEAPRVRPGAAADVITRESGERRPRPLKLLAQIPLILLLLIGVVCVGKLLLLSTNPKVIVLGKNDISASYLKSNETYQTAAAKLLAGSITSHTKITVNLDGTAAAMEKQFPELQDVSVTLPLIGNRPIVYAAVAQPSVIVQSTHGNYALNKSGLVLAHVSRLPAGVPLLVDQSNVSIKPGQQYLPSSTIAFIQAVAYQFSAAKVALSAFVLPAATSYELDVRLEGKPYLVRCNLTTDAVVQSGAAIATLQHLGTTVPASYIDVRVPGRVYYK
jgi:hypothetical protein